MRVLFTILDWGLGHATRSVPLIDEAIGTGAEPIIAARGLSLAYLQKRFPEIKTVELPDKEVKYGDKGAFLSLAKRAVQQTSINKMQFDWTQKTIADFGITHIISDNVYGCFSPKIPSVIISHQLSLKAPFGKSLVNKELAHWLEKFQEIWVPDLPGDHSLAGDLLINPFLKKEPKFLGHISRFSQKVEVDKKIEYLAILSGPEPQRSIFEKQIVSAFKDFPEQLTLVRGTLLQSAPISGINTFDMLMDDELEAHINSAENVICRSGYTSLLDLVALNAKACLVPTPQQYEQEYLANRMKENGWFEVQEQKNWEMKKGLNQFPIKTSKGFKEILESFLKG